MKRYDPHVHARPLSPCSHLSQEDLVAFYLDHPEHIVTVSDHMSLDFYDKYVGPGKTFSEYETLFAVEVSMRTPAVDILLITYDLSAFDALRPILATGGRYLEHPPLAVFADPRIIVTWAHPETVTPLWLTADVIDFVEFNSTHIPLSGDSFGDLKHVERLGKFFVRNFIVGSDSHQGWTLGLTYVEFDNEVRNSREAWNALKNGEFTNNWSERVGYLSDDRFEWRFSPDTRFPLLAYPKIKKLEKDFDWRAKLHEKHFANQLEGWPEDDEEVIDKELHGFLSGLPGLEGDSALPVEEKVAKPVLLGDITDDVKARKRGNRRNTAWQVSNTVV